MGDARTNGKESAAFASAEVVKKQYESKIKALENSYNALQDVLKQRITTSSKEKASLEKKIRDLEEKCGEKDFMLRSIQQEHRKISDEYERLVAAVQKEYDRNPQTEANKSPQHTDLAMEFLRAERTINQLQEALSESEKSHRIQITQMQERETITDESTRNSAAENSQIIDELRTANSRLNSELSQVREELKKRDQSHESTLADYKERISKNNHVLEELKSNYERKISLLKDESEQLQLTNEELRKERDSLRDLIRTQIENQRSSSRNPEDFSSLSISRILNSPRDTTTSSSIINSISTPRTHIENKQSPLGTNIHNPPIASTQHTLHHGDEPQGGNSSRKASDDWLLDAAERLSDGTTMTGHSVFSQEFSSDGIKPRENETTPKKVADSPDFLNTPQSPPPNQTNGPEQQSTGQPKLVTYLEPMNHVSVASIITSSRYRSSALDYPQQNGYTHPLQQGNHTASSLYHSPSMIQLKSPTPSHPQELPPYQSFRAGNQPSVGDTTPRYIHVNQMTHSSTQHSSPPRQFQGHVPQTQQNHEEMNGGHATPRNHPNTVIQLSNGPNQRNISVPLRKTRSYESTRNITAHVTNTLMNQPRAAFPGPHHTPEHVPPQNIEQRPMPSTPRHMSSPAPQSFGPTMTSVSSARVHSLPAANGGHVLHSQIHTHSMPPSLASMPLSPRPNSFYILNSRS